MAPVVTYVPEGDVNNPTRGHLSKAGTITLPEEHYMKLLEYGARSLAIHGFTDHTSMGHGVGAGRRGGPDDPLPYDSLDPGDIGAVWTTARVLRHFRARTAADVRIAWDVADLAALDAALAPVAAKGGYLSATANDIVHVPVAWSKALAGNGGAGAPVVARSTHHADALHRDGVTPQLPLHDALDRFWRGVREHDVVGRERGLMLSFRDPRAVVPGLRRAEAALSEAADDAAAAADEAAEEARERAADAIDEAADEVRL